MKKFTLFLLSAIAAVCSFAQTVGEHGELIGQYGAIYQMPEGAVAHEYVVDGIAAYYTETDGIFTVEDHRTIEVYEFEDGTMFFKDLLSGVKYGSFVKGRRVDDKIHISMNQVLAHDKNYDHNILLAHIVIPIGEDMYDDPGDVIYNVTEEGGCEVISMVSNIAEYNFLGAEYDDENASLVAGENAVFVGDAATVLIYNPNKSELDEAVAWPEDIAFKTYSCNAFSYRGWAETNYTQYKYVDFDIDIAISGDDVYVRGLYYPSPEYVVRGKMQDGIVTFPQHQFLGKEGRGVDVYALACQIVTVYDEEYEMEEEVMTDAPSWTLFYDAEHDTYSGDDSVVRFASNPFYRQSNSYEQLDEIVITPKDNSGIAAAAGSLPAKHIICDLQGRKVHNVRGLVISTKDGKAIKQIAR